MTMAYDKYSTVYRYRQFSSATANIWASRCDGNTSKNRHAHRSRICLRAGDIIMARQPRNLILSTRKLSGVKTRMRVMARIGGARVNNIKYRRQRHRRSIGASFKGIGASSARIIGARGAKLKTSAPSRASRFARIASSRARHNSRICARVLAL